MSAIRRMSFWVVRKSCSGMSGAVVQGETYAGDVAGERIDLALLGGAVGEAGQNMLGVQFVERGNCAIVSSLVGTCTYS